MKYKKRIEELYLNEPEVVTEIISSFVKKVLIPVIKHGFTDKKLLELINEAIKESKR